MVLDKRCPVDATDWQTLVEFLGAGDGATAFYGARNRYPCMDYVVYTDGTYIYAENGTTGELDFGGPTSEGTVDGTDASAVIQAATDAITHGNICIKGDMTLNTPVEFKDNISYYGHMNTLTFGGSGFIFTSYDQTQYVENVGWHRFIFYAKNNVNCDGGIDLSGCWRCIVDEVYFWEFRDKAGSICVKMGTTAANLRSYQNLVTHSRFRHFMIGVYIAGNGGGDLHNNRCEYSVFGSINTYGIYITEGKYNYFMQNDLEGIENGGYAIYLDTNAKRNVFMDCYLEGPGVGDTGIYLADWATGNMFIGGTISTFNVLVSDNSNDYTHAEPNQWWNIMHYYVNNSGTATLLNGNTTVVVAHGLGDASALITPEPQNIKVHPIETLNNATFWWVDTITNANFTINVDANPGQDVDFAWVVNRRE